MFAVSDNDSPESTRKKRNNTERKAHTDALTGLVESVKEVAKAMKPEQKPRFTDRFKTVEQWVDHLMENGLTKEQCVDIPKQFRSPVLCAVAKKDAILSCFHFDETCLSVWEYLRDQYC